MTHPRTYLLLLICLVFVSSCVSPSQTQTQYEALEAQSEADFVAYINCMKTAANYYSASTASPHEIADAAQSKCGAEFHAYEMSTENSVTYRRVTKAGFSTGVALARDLTQEMKGEAKEKVVQWVIDNRLHKK
jgi:hypothetical protein